MCGEVHGGKNWVIRFFDLGNFLQVHDRIGKQLTSMTLQQQPSLQNQQTADPSRVVGSYK